MCILMKSFIFLIFFFAKSDNIKSDAINLPESNDEYDVLVKTALFEKINFMIKEMNNITRQYSDLKKRLHNQNQIVRNNMDALKLEMQNFLGQQELKNGNFVVGLQKEIASSFDAQKYYFESSILKAENFIKYDDGKFLHNRNWQTILRRQDGSLSFNRTWLEYKTGFGNVNGNYFMGLESLHAITTYSDPQELLIVLQDFDNKTRYAKYADFVVASETEKYKILKLGSYQGDAGDSFTRHYNMKFSTYDQDNDNTTMTHCAERYQGGWWFSNCFSSHLTGVYLYQPATGDDKDKGLLWSSWHNLQSSLKYVEMMIRPKLT